MKKWVSLLLVLAVICSFGLFALGSSSDDSDSGSQDKTTNQGNANATEEADSTEATEATEDNTRLGDYSVEIKSFRLAKAYDGKPVVIVTYTFTNVDDDEASAFYLTIKDTVYQNGVGLNEALFLADSAKYSSDNQTKEIKKGASLDVEVAYELNDTTTDIEVEVSKLISFDKKVLKKTFKIAQ